MKITTTQHIRIEFDDGYVKELSEQEAKKKNCIQIQASFYLKITAKKITLSWNGVRIGKHLMCLAQIQIQSIITTNQQHNH